MAPDRAVQEELRRLPSVDVLLHAPAIEVMLAVGGRSLAVDAIRAVLDEAREMILAGGTCPAEDVLARQAVRRLRVLARPTLRPVINATGVVIHTNLGRAPLSEAALEAMAAVGRAYSNLEYDLDAGQRGSRYVHANDLLCRLTGAEAALVVNNNAGAVLLALSALASGREVVISRGQLIEIGGGFRIPDVMRQSGAHLVEVGTTNRTYAQDYEEAIREETTLLMRVHQSNFRLTGFVHQTGLAELVELARTHHLRVVDDLGSGTLLDTEPFGLTHEPMVQESVAAEADLVSFSGDKLLGGPQAGIIVGRGELITRLKRFPLTRALRVDKTTLIGLQVTLLHYLKEEATEQIPVWRMIAMPLAEIEERAQRWARQLERAGAQVAVTAGRSTVGGGSLPGETLPTRLVAIQTPSPDDVARRLRLGHPPVVGRIERDQLLLDPRTVLPEQDDDLLRTAAAYIRGM
jgi:L-seryl-tRNA(Ser) seleniumtransferase